MIAVALIVAHSNTEMFTHFIQKKMNDDFNLPNPNVHNNSAKCNNLLQNDISKLSYPAKSFIMYMCTRI